MSESPHAKDRDFMSIEGHPTDYQPKAAAAYCREWA
jgi:hypothetical protein